ncbi:hypothetical protein SLS53_006797 [Cytospora paraplurivora]|uniref:Xylanolytic transcriptional activator regulatory domain-containing protein n=1 Tax=Cytospora paraplurivora TaxID=2898453 RepID=A0AAN9YEG1_9PEZI
MHDRVVQLERLVKYISQNTIKKPEAVAQNQAEANLTSEPNHNQTIESFSSNLGTPVDDQSGNGSMRMSGSEIHYVNEEHWAAILDNIADLKDHFNREEQSRLVTGPVGNLDDDSTPIMWVGLLFGMICLSAMTSAASESTQGNEAEQQRLQTELYREKIVQCLVMGEYTKAGPHVLETVMHYVYVEMLLRADSSKDIWYLLALEVNLAKRMGYHRDPSHFSDVSPLQGEMRRRLWVTILLGDILISSQMGMPRMIVDWQCDTAEPRNLYDDDLDLDSSENSELPPARPETEQTTALGVIASRRILVALGAVSDLTATVKPCSYAEVMRVDGILNEALESIPPPLRLRPIAASMTDSPQLIMSRLFLAHMFYKGQIMLHRRFLRVSEDAAAYSRKACLDASLGTLQIQHILDEETCAGGQLDTMRWRITSIMNHQFLTAAMILCMLLQRGQTLQRGEEITAALWRTKAIWTRSNSGSREARKGVETVIVVLAKFGVGSPPEAVVEGGMLVNHNPSMALPVSNSYSSDKMSYQSEDVLPGTLDQSEPSTSVLPGLLADDQCGHNDSFLMDFVEGDVTLDDWVVMSGMGMDW